MIQSRRHLARRAFTDAERDSQRTERETAHIKSARPFSLFKSHFITTHSLSLTIKHSQYGVAESPENYGYGVAANYGRARRRTSDRDA